jgi:xanthine dehydrogenase molybdopterin-binding subunit B
MFVSETILDDVARRLGLSPTLVREMNFYGEGSVTHYGQTLEACQVGFAFHIPAERPSSDLLPLL